MNTVTNFDDYERTASGGLVRKKMVRRQFEDNEDQGASDLKKSSSETPAIVTDPKRLIDNDQSPLLARFFAVADDAITTLERCQQHLQEGSRFAADDELLSARQELSELFMTREISDAVALITLRSLQALGQDTVLECADVLNDVVYAMRKLRNAPYMSFRDATKLVSSLPKSDDLNAVYNEFVGKLIAEDEGE